MEPVTVDAQTPVCASAPLFPAAVPVDGMHRREFLATGAALAVAATGGCTGCARAPSAALRMAPVTDPEITRRAIDSFENPDSERRALVGQVAADGSATVEARDPPLPAGEPILYEDAVYRLSRTVVDTRTVREFAVTINPVRDDEDVPDAETVRYADLPAVDREVLAARGFDDARPPGIGTTLTYPPDTVDESALVPEPERPVVVWPDGPARITVDDSFEVQLTTYRYTGERVASAAAYGGDLREQFGFRLSGLSGPQREIVTEAIEADHGYTIPPEEDVPATFRELAERFRPHATVPDGETGSVDGAYVLRYEGETYWSEIRAERRE